MSSSAIRSSIENSPWSATISVRRSSPKPWVSSESSSFRIFMRRGFDARISLHSLMNLRTSRSSSSSLVISRAVSRARRMLRISADCFSDNLNRLRNAASAAGVSFDFLMIRMTSSMWSTAIFRPSRMCSRSWARCSSNWVLRVMTLCRCSMKCCSSSLRFISFRTQFELQRELGPAGDDTVPVLDEVLQQFLEVHLLRRAVHERQHDGAEGHLHLRVLIQLIQDHERHDVPLQLDDEANALLVGLVADV